MKEDNVQTFVLNPSLSNFERNIVINRLVQFLKKHKIRDTNVSITVSDAEK